MKKTMNQVALSEPKSPLVVAQARPACRSSFVRVFGMVMVFAMMMMVQVFATGQLETGIQTGMGQIYKLIQTIVIPVAAVVLSWNAFKAFTGGQKGMEEAKKNIFACLAVIVLVLLAPVIVTTVQGWFSGVGDGGIFGSGGGN